MDSRLHFISGLPRSGSTLLAAILRQNPQFHAGMSSPVANLCGQLLATMRAGNEWSVQIDGEQRENILRSVFDGYYRKILSEKVVFDTNRAWCSRMPALARLFPAARIIACVRDYAWIVDSFERVTRKSPFLLSKMFTPEQSQTVYSRVEHLTSPPGSAGFAWNALREAYFGEHASGLIVVDYEALTREPQRTLESLYEHLGFPYFPHDFGNVSYAEGDEFDERIGVPGLHAVSGSVRFVERPTILPPDIFQRFSNRCFWRGPHSIKRGLTVLAPELQQQQVKDDAHVSAKTVFRERVEPAVMTSAATG
jgi:sulfotransferase